MEFESSIQLKSKRFFRSPSPSLSPQKLLGLKIALIPIFLKNEDGKNDYVREFQGDEQKNETVCTHNEQSMIIDNVQLGPVLKPI